MGNFYLKNPYKLAARLFETLMINKSYEKKHLRAVLDSFNYDEFTEMH